ncbi:hypothetical protein B0H14DRAFT_2590208 [Mycena olivaceomarginata]|nr:hypothetical protein B0H14DRAFT_2590208 [Mycena olivaceomarginata]
MPSTQIEMETYTLGAWFAHYLSLNKCDSTWMKLFVAGLALLTTLKTLESLAIMWIQNVTMFGDREAGSNIWHKHWVWYTSLMLEAITRVLCPDVFLPPSLGEEFQIGAISRNAYLVIICITLFLFAVVSGLVAVCPLQLSFITTNFCNTVRLQFYKYLEVDDPLGWDASWSCAVRRLAAERKHNMLFASPAALCALINFAGNMGSHATGWTPALVMINFIPNMVLPQLYAWSAMWTLNSRREICLAAESCSYTINLLRTTAGGSSDSEKHQDTPEPLVKAQKTQLGGPPQSMV